jgi:hypothetical protein
MVAASRRDLLSRDERRWFRLLVAARDAIVDTFRVHVRVHAINFTSCRQPLTTGIY